MKTKLILFEGIPGSGKSTFAHNSDLFLKKAGVDSLLYEEGCLHPANLDGYCIIPVTNLDELCSAFPECEKKIRAHAIITGDYALIQRQKNYHPNSNIFRYLQKYAVWDNGLDFLLFKELHLERWRRFSLNLKDTGKTAIFECAFLQDHITELMLYYEKTKYEIVEYFAGLESTISNLNPFLIYLRQENVKETIDRVAVQRVDTDNDTSWAKNVAEMISESPYGKTNHLSGYEGLIDFFSRRKEVDLFVLSSLKMRHIIVDNNSYDWNSVREEVLQIIKNLVIEECSADNN